MDADQIRKHAQSYSAMRNQNIKDLRSKMAKKVRAREITYKSANFTSKLQMILMKEDKQQ